MERLSNEATPGPWENHWNELTTTYDAGGKTVVGMEEGTDFYRTPFFVCANNDMEFIAAARNALPKLVAMVRLLQDPPDAPPVDLTDELERILNGENGGS